MSLYEDKLFEYEYLIDGVIERLNIADYKQEFKEIGKVALLVAYKTYDRNQSLSFPEHAFNTITNRFESELKAISKYLNIKLGLELYQNHHLAPIIEKELLKRIEMSYLFLSIDPITQQIIKYYNRDFSYKKIANKLNIDHHEVKTRIKASIDKIYQLVNKID